MATEKRKRCFFSAAIQIGPHLSSIGIASADKIDSVCALLHEDKRTSDCRRPFIPTTSLFRPDKTFHSFGFDAEWEYEELNHIKRDDWYYFKGLTAISFDKKHNDYILVDKTGKTMKAVRVFDAAIGYCINYVETRVKKRLHDLKQHDIQWTITAPNLTDDGARLFFKEAAIQAGIHEDNLLLIDEIDALLVYCNANPNIKKCMSLSRYLIMDTRGSYTNLIVAESNKVVCKTYCRNVCEEQITTEFCKLMEELCTKAVFDRYRDKEAGLIYDENYIERFVDRLSYFNGKKAFNLTVCVSEGMSNGTIMEALQSRLPKLQKYGKNVKLIGNNLQIHELLVIQMFTETVDNIEDQLTKIFNNECAAAVDTIVLNGRLGTCPFVVEKIEKLYPQKRVISLENDGSAYLSGAAYYGNDPTLLDEITTGSDEIRTYEYHLQSLSATLRNGSDTVDDLQSLMSDEYKETCQSSLIDDKKIVNLSLPFTKDTSTINFHIFGVPVAANPLDANNIVCRLLGHMTVDAKHWKPHTSVNLCMCYDSKQMNIEVVEESLSDKMQALNMDSVAVTTGKQEATRLALPCPSATSRVSFPICVTSFCSEGVSSRVLGQFAVELKDWKKDKTVILRMKLCDEKIHVEVEE